jgi:hypothetical protein
MEEEMLTRSLAPRLGVGLRPGHLTEFIQKSQAEDKKLRLVRQAHHLLSHPERSRGTGWGIKGIIII